MAAQRAGRRGQEMADDEAHTPLQAILLADSFTQRFRPITMERPKVLLPLVGVPMIDYTLEWLASAGIEEVFVFCCAHAKQVTSYLKTSRWKSQPNFKLTCIQSDDCVSAGDALRSIDQRNVVLCSSKVLGDFVLVSGDTVSNMPLKEVIQEHKARRTKDKLAVMTMVVKRCKPSPLTHQTRLGNEELVLAIDPATKQLLHYGAPNKQRQSILLDKNLLAGRQGVRLHLDMQDCHIDICSPEVLMLFTDNFDYQQMRRDFVRGLLSDEIMGNKVYTYEIFEDYATRIDNFRAYDVVSKDVLHRWTYPIVPEVSFSDSQATVNLDRCNKYREQGATVSRNALIGENTFLGQGTTIGSHSKIKNSVIGRGCKIGENVVVEGSYIWDNVTIADNVQVIQSIICDGVLVKAGARLEPGVVLSFKVTIGENFTVPQYSKISRVPEPTEQDSSDEELEYADSTGDDSGGRIYISANKVQVGQDGAGYRWFKDAVHDEEWKQSAAAISGEKIKELMAKQEQEEDDIQDVDVIPEEKLLSDEEESVDEDDNFEKEVEENFKRAVNGVKLENVVLEVNSLKLGYNKAFSDCAGAMFRAMLNLALETPHSTAAELLSTTKQVISKWSTLFRNFLKSEDDQIEVLLKFEELCLESASEFSPLFSKVVEELYDKDLVSEEAVMSWASEKAGAEEADKVFLRQCESFIKWLNEAEEEESEED
ncbi:hypothetical protein SELMODRAFT_166978 [Selaginella moellendorffii]|uniref:Translation initiation factor eIF2B subunit epsilon n=1 Tax=Selaginella moellendorffii TaxID=88036 RepID=D8R0N0_SELML|nr:hypothetical protein SELMODRAFT_166978 [Selaginella moellendorffii]